MFFVRCRSLRPLLRSAKQFSTATTSRASFVGEQLFSRATVQVAGAEAGQFLQGLITNDIQLLDGDKPGAMYTVLLNVQGRIMFDTFVFRRGDDFLLNCDASLASHLIKHLKMYKVRRKIDITHQEDLQTWAVFESPCPSSGFDPVKDLSRTGLIISTDPRVPGLGFRALVSSTDSEAVDVLKKNSVDVGSFNALRHAQGVAEGSGEIPFGKCFPLEYNLDLMNGVNFHKGCYIGQELTARTHHTGVIRKRILPLRKVSETGPAIETGHTIVNEKDKSIGQVRGVSGLGAIGLMRVEEVKAAQSLTVKETGESVTCSFPDWWPSKA